MQDSKNRDGRRQHGRGVSSKSPLLVTKDKRGSYAEGRSDEEGCEDCQKAAEVFQR